MSPSEIVAAEAERRLPLATIRLPDEYYYQSLPLCVIDAVFSIGVRYEGVRRVVARYCEKTGQSRVRPSRYVLPDPSDQESIGHFCYRFEETGTEAITSEYFQNRQRTSTANGILKSEAVYRFACVLRDREVEYLQDVPSIAESGSFATAIKNIPGQKSGISLQYFWMLAGSDDFIKPDRMVIRFLESALRRPVRIEEAPDLLREATVHLRGKNPRLTPRLLDYAIWQHQRQADARPV